MLNSKTLSSTVSTLYLAKAFTDVKFQCTAFHPYLATEMELTGTVFSKTTVELSFQNLIMQDEKYHFYKEIFFVDFIT